MGAVRVRCLHGVACGWNKCAIAIVVKVTHQRIQLHRWQDMLGSGIEDAQKFIICDNTHCCCYSCKSHKEMSINLNHSKKIV